MPVLFGRQGGPRQSATSPGRHSTTVGRTLLSWVAMHADAEQLQALLPRGFELGEPLLVVEGASLHGLPWLAGRGYQLMSVSIPVVFTAQGRRTHGRLELVTWENLADPIVSGRDELGFSKIYADSITCEVTEALDAVRWAAAWDGTRFLEMEVSLTGALTSPPSWRTGPVFHYRVLPRTGAWGEVEVEQVTANTEEALSATIVAAQTGDGVARFLPSGFDALPTLVHVVDVLAGLALGPAQDAGHLELTGWSDAADMRIVAAWPVDPPVIHELP